MTRVSTTATSRLAGAVGSEDEGVRSVSGAGLCIGHNLAMGGVIKLTHSGHFV